ncbi:MAG: Ig-like domain-containing protein [Hyphomicrobiaceae bacterium]
MQLLRYLSMVLVLSATEPSATGAGSLKCTTAPSVTQFYPTADVLPENLLRFYIYFSEPMQRSDTLDFVKLVDDRKTTVPGAFLANKYQLWSPDGRRLTLLFDPGRVKTGLVAHNRFGRALKAPRSYRLVIDSNLRSSEGCAQSRSHTKVFRTVSADYDPPDLDKWSVRQPQAGTRGALAITLNGSLDHVSLAYGLRVKDDAGRTVRGRIDLADNEARWIFTPDQAWQNQQYRIVVDPVLEDIAGNRLTGTFERPLVEMPYQPGDRSYVIAFTPNIK